jgi:uncharacterized protein (UPF0548 family)
MLRLRRPSTEALDRLLADQRSQQPTYACVGATLRGDRPSGYRHDRYETELGRGDQAWSDAIDALKGWQPQRGSGLTVIADGPVAEGTTVVIAAPLPLGFALAACRIVGVVVEDDAWGFAYGTLPAHPEEGEELFVVRRRDGIVRFEIVAFSKPRHPLVRLGAPLARTFQAQATRRYLTAMEAEAGSQPGV